MAGKLPWVEFRIRVPDEAPSGTITIGWRTFAPSSVPSATFTLRTRDEVHDGSFIGSQAIRFFPDVGNKARTL